MKYELLEGRLIMQARKLLQQRLDQLEQLETEVNSGAWTRRLNVFFQSHVALASAMDEWHEIDKRLRSMISNWAEDQLGVIPLRPISKIECAVIEKQTLAAVDDCGQVLTVGAIPLVNARENAARHTAAGAKFAMKKSALIKEHKHEWPSIATDIAGAQRNGLATAKAGTRGWREADAMEWARSNAKLKSAPQPSNRLVSAMHEMIDLPVRRHKLKG